MADDTNNSRGNILARALADSVCQRYPDQFTPEQVEQLRRAIVPIAKIIATLRQYPLTNADEPDPSFHAFRGDG